jgi:hypothetical protein
MITEADLAKLTHRQREMLGALARQLSSDEVARLLHIAEATLKIDMTSFRVRFHHWPRPSCPPSQDSLPVPGSVPVWNSADWFATPNANLSRHAMFFTLRPGKQGSGYFSSGIAQLPVSDGSMRSLKQ